MPLDLSGQRNNQFGLDIEGRATHGAQASPYSQFQQQYPEMDRYARNVLSGRIAAQGLNQLAGTLEQAGTNPQALEQYLGVGGITKPAKLLRGVEKDADDAYGFLKKDYKVNVDMKSSPYTEDLGRRSIVDFDDAKVQLTIREDADNIFVTNIAAKQPDDLAKQAKGTNRGTQVLNKLKEYSDRTGKRLAVVDATEPAKSFYEKIPYLDREAVTLKFEGADYTPPISFSYKPKTK
jgi:hypothetical protein